MENIMNNVQNNSYPMVKLSGTTDLGRAFVF